MVERILFLLLSLPIIIIIIFVSRCLVPLFLHILMALIQFALLSDSRVSVLGARCAERYNSE